MDEHLTSTIPRSGQVRQVQAITAVEEAHAPASGFADESGHLESRRDSASSGEPGSGDVHGAHPPEDVWDPETWSGPARTLLTIVAVAAPFVLWFYTLDHLPEAWVDWAAIPILGLGEMIAGALFVFVYGSVRTSLRLLRRRFSNPRQVGRHRR